MTYNPARQITPYLVYKGGPGSRDTLARSGAHELAAEIQAWWHKRGFPQVRVWVEQVFGKECARETWGVRSNLVGGLPPREVREEAA